MRRKSPLPKRPRRRYARLFSAFLRARVSRRPIVLSHLITLRCDCDCDFCLWKSSSDDELSTNELIQFYRDAKDAGFIATTFWGGEPLIREDFPDVLRYAHGLGFMTVVITNGYSLPSKAAEVAPFLTTAIVSIDYPSAFHDTMRKKEGVFERAIQGIEEVRARNRDCKVLINCLVSTLNGDKIEEMILFADKLRVPVSFQLLDTRDVGFEGDATAFKLDAEEESEILKVVKSYKRRGYRISNSYTYLDSFIGGKKGYRCHTRKLLLMVLPNGDVWNCLTGEALANVRDAGLKEIISMPAMRRFQKEAEKCFRCNDRVVIECSYFWKLKPEVILNTFRVFV